MTTNLSVIANVKQLRTGGSFRILLPFFRTCRGVDFLNSAIFNSFHNRVGFGTILEGLRNLGGGGLFEPDLTVYTVCPTRYRTQHFVNNSNTKDDIATKFEQEYVRCVRNEEECVSSPLQISFQYP